MLRIATAVVLAFVVAPVVAGADESESQLFTLSSPAFGDDGVLPLKYAGGMLCGKDSRGGNVSPPLAWANSPPGTKSFAVVMIDPDGRRGLGSVHWVAYGIPATRMALPEGAGNPAGNPAASDVVDGKNSRGTLGYTGPCGPPVDAPHHYLIEVLALDLPPADLQAGLSRDQLLTAIAGHSLGPASLVVRYRRTP